MEQDIIREKIEKSIELICPICRKGIIDDAYIVGSVAKGTAKRESDIDIVIISDLEDVDLDPNNIYATKIVKALKDIGVEFKYITTHKYQEEGEEGFAFWYQLYKSELFHILPRDRINPFIEGIRIIDLCDKMT